MGPTCSATPTPALAWCHAGRGKVGGGRSGAAWRRNRGWRGVRGWRAYCPPWRRRAESPADSAVLVPAKPQEVRACSERTYVVIPARRSKVVLARDTLNPTL